MIRFLQHRAPFLRSYFAGIVLLLPIWAASRPGYLPNGHLDLAQLATRYKDGDFEQLQTVLDEYVKRPLKQQNSAETIFAYKYLGVIYGADSANAPKAESYFHKLLGLAPNVDIIDLYVSKKVEAIFDRVKKEFQLRQAYKNNFDSLGRRMTPPSTTNIQPANGAIPLPSGKIEEKKSPQFHTRAPKKIERNHSWVYWSLGAASVGAGVAVYILASQTSSTSIPDSIDAGAPQ